jgi:hypothetical protein
MTLEASLLKLNKNLEQLEGALDNLLWAVVQAQPQEEPGHALADHYDIATSDLLGLVKEAKEAAETGRNAAEGRLDFAGVRQALIICQDRFNQLWDRFYNDLVSLERIEALNNLAQEPGSKWRPWREGVRDALSQCPQLLHEVGQALLPCWQTLTEWPNTLSISMQVSNVGQEIHLA